MEGTTPDPARRTRPRTAGSDRGGLARHRALAVAGATAAALLASALALLVPTLIQGRFTAGASNCEHSTKSAGACTAKRGRHYKSEPPAPPPPDPSPPPPQPPPPGTTPPPDPSGGVPSTWRRSNSYESPSDFSLLGPIGWVDDTWRTAPGFEIARTGERGGIEGPGHYSIRITGNGTDDCSCPRMKFQNGFSFGPGDELWISGSWLIPEPRRLSWSRLMNLGHFESSGSARNWYLGLESTDPGTFQVSYAPYGNPHTAVLGPRAIPADRWFRVDLHFVLSPTDGRALTEWFIDGRRVDATTRANMLDSDPLGFYNAGLPYFWSGNGRVSVYFDAPRLTF